MSGQEAQTLLTRSTSLAQLQGTDEPIHQLKSWGPRHADIAVSKASSLPDPVQPGRPITGLASHTDGQPRLQLSGAHLTSLIENAPAPVEVT